MGAIVFATALFLSLGTAGVRHVYADTPPTSPTPAPNGDFIDDESQPDAFQGLCSGIAPVGAICHEAPDMGEHTSIGQSTATKHTETTGKPPVTRTWFDPVGTAITHTYDINYKPAPGYTRPDFTHWADWDTNEDPYMTPATIQTNTTPFTNPQYETDMGRTCYYDDRGNLVWQSLSNSKYRISLPWVNPLVQHSKNLASELGLFKNDNLNFEQATEYVKKAALYGCGFVSLGTESAVNPIKSEGIVIFDLYQLLQYVWHLADSIKSHAVIENSTRTPKSEQYTCWGPGCIQADFLNSPVTGKEKNLYTQKSSGFIESYKVVDYRPSQINARVVDNPMQGSFDTLTTTTQMDNLVQAGYNYLCDAVTLAVLQQDRCSPTPTLTPTPPAPLSCDPNQPVTVGTPQTTNTNTLTYSLPYQNTACVVSDQMICQAESEMRLYYSGMDWQTGTKNLNLNAKYVQAQAAADGMNPTLALALWIEESAGINGLSCGSSAGGSGSDQSFMSSQVQCAASLAKNLTPFSHFMCQYAGEDEANGYMCNTPATSAYTLNPDFPPDIQFWYGFLSQQESASCQITNNPTTSPTP